MGRVSVYQASVRDLEEECAGQTEVWLTLTLLYGYGRRSTYNNNNKALFNYTNAHSEK